MELIRPSTKNCQSESRRRNRDLHRHRAVNAQIREKQRSLCDDTRQLSWIDWLQHQATNGRTDALEALRVARGRDLPSRCPIVSREQLSKASSNARADLRSPCPHLHG